MEPSEYLMWMKKRSQQFLKYSNFQVWKNSINEYSWEEKAFAEDAGSGSGSLWPPRCYSCSFCKREFRSAQALGGHMNVHRRDRARLKQNYNNNLNLISPNNSTTSSILDSSRVSAAKPNSIKNPRQEEEEEDYRISSDPSAVETNLFVGFDSLSCKRPKTAISTVSFLINPCLSDRYSLETEVIKANSVSMEDIDLELRLGEPTKVK